MALWIWIVIGIVVAIGLGLFIKSRIEFNRSWNMFMRVIESSAPPRNPFAPRHQQPGEKPRGPGGKTRYPMGRPYEDMNCDGWRSW